MTIRASRSAHRLASVALSANDHRGTPEPRASSAPTQRGVLGGQHRGQTALDSGPAHRSPPTVGAGEWPAIAAGVTEREVDVGVPVDVGRPGCRPRWRARAGSRPPTSPSRSSARRRRSASAASAAAPRAGVGTGELARALPLSRAVSSGAVDLGHAGIGAQSAPRIVASTLVTRRAGCVRCWRRAPRRPADAAAAARAAGADPLRQARPAAVHQPPRHRPGGRAGAAAGRRAGGASSGFNPHPRISYAGAAPTGAASEAEYLEIALAAPVRAGPAARARSMRRCPPGLDVVDAVTAGPGSLADRLQASHWVVELPGVPVAAAARAVGALPRRRARSRSAG